MGKKTFVSELFTFAYFPNYDKSIEYLAENLAEPEDWEFSDAEKKSYSILKNYLEHIFRRLRSEGKVTYTPRNSHACFNTGLVTKNLEPIFAFFEAYRKPRHDEKSYPPFYFKAFLREYDIRFLKVFPGHHPGMADFFERPEDLIFNPRCKFIPQLDYIIESSLPRFPSQIRMLDSHEIRRRLYGAIEEVRKRVKNNYKWAVPQFYNNCIQLLLPLNLTSGFPDPDLALVIHKISEDIYTARTCLTLKTAYNNARLIAKPQSVWLKP